jgi:hypothetical protein
MVLEPRITILPFAEGAGADACFSAGQPASITLAQIKAMVRVNRDGE